MAEKAAASPVTVYPDLGSKFDLWFARLSGHGLGNSFYSYFHAVVLAEQFGGRVIAPPWPSIKVGPLLRGDNSKRFYWRMFRPFPGEIYGFQKSLSLLKGWLKRTYIFIEPSSRPPLVAERLNVVCSRAFTFNGLHPYRNLIRNRLLGIVNDPLPENHSWGKGKYIAVHVRLGDFAAVTDPLVISGGKSNTRIPISWYANLVKPCAAIIRTARYISSPTATARNFSHF
jgi:hypothetical protein